MALYLCDECAAHLHLHSGESPQRADSGQDVGGLPHRLISPLRACVGALAGALIGFLSGNPVAIAVGAAAGALGSNLRLPDSGTVLESGSSGSDACAICGSREELEVCGKCGRTACPSHRRLIMSEEERDGLHVYRHYIPDREIDEDIAFLPLQPSIADSQEEELTQTTYRLGEDLYVIDEETGELTPLDGEADDLNPEGDDACTTRDHVTSSQSSPDEWGEFSAWSPPNWESGN